MEENQLSNQKLEVQNLTVQYSSKKILDDVSFTLEQGQFVCLCGPNGAGKTTLLSAVCGLTAVTKGTEISVTTGTTGTDLSDSSDSINLLKLSAREKAKIIACMQQNERSIWNFTVQDYVLQGRFVHSNGGYYSKEDYQVAQSVLQELNMDSFADRTVHSLSGGEFQKVRIARALAQEPLFLLLDEPAANLDYVYEPQLMTLLKNLARKKNIGILISIHDINLAWRYADKIMLLGKEKNLISGAPDDIMTVENLRTTFGVDFQCKETKLFQSLQ